MSQEWLKQLADLSNDKELRERARKLEKTRFRSAVRQAGPARRRLLGAAVGNFFRWLFLFGLAEAAAMFVVADSQGLTGEPWGVTFHYLAWYALTQPILPVEVSGALQDWFGVAPADLTALYDRIDPVLEEQRDLLVFLVPAAAALASTLFFLPAINAGRRRSPIRFLVWLANWAVLFLMRPWGPGIVVLWLAAFVFSFAGGGIRVARQQPQAQHQPQPATPASRPAVQPQKAARPAASAVPAVGRPVQRSARDSFALDKREPTVLRRGGGASWVRAR